MGGSCPFYVIRLISVWAPWQLVWQVRITFHHMRQKDYRAHTIAHVHNIAHVNCGTCIYFFLKQTATLSGSSKLKIPAALVQTVMIMEMFLLRGTATLQDTFWKKFQKLKWNKHFSSLQKPLTSTKKAFCILMFSLRNQKRA